MVQAVLDALSAPAGGGDLRTRPERYHDALAEAMRRLLASDLLPQRAGQPVKALVHIYFAELRERDHDGILQDNWIAEYRARWAAHRAANSVSTGDGGAWLEGDAARQVACDAMIIPVVIGDIDPGAVEDLIALCVQFHQLRTQCAPADHDVPGHADAPDRATTQDPTGTQDRTASQDAPDASAAVPAGLTSSTARHAEQAAAVADTLAALEQQILAQDPAGRLRARRRRLVPAPPPARQAPGRPLPPPGRRPDRRHPPPPTPPRRPPGSALPVPRRLRPARVRLRAPPRPAPIRRRPHQPHQPQGLLLVAPPRRPARTRLDPDRPPRRHQPGPKSRRHDHPQSQPPTPPRVTTPPSGVHRYLSFSLLAARTTTTAVRSAASHRQATSTASATKRPPPPSPCTSTPRTCPGYVPASAATTTDGMDQRQRNL